MTQPTPTGPEPREVTEEDIILGRKPHSVRLTFEVMAEHPLDSVEAFIDQIVQYGLRPWNFRVTDSDGRSWVVNGEDVYTEQEFVELHRGE